MTIKGRLLRSTIPLLSVFRTEITPELQAPLR